MTDHGDFIGSLDDEDKNDDEFLEIKAFWKAWQNFSLYASWYIGELDWNIVGDDDGRQKLMEVIKYLGEWLPKEPTGLVEVVIPRGHAKVVYDLLRECVRDMCWQEIPEETGIKNLDGEFDPEKEHGLMVGLYASVYAALGTTEAA